VKNSLLFITRDFTQNIEKSTSYLCTQLAKCTNIQLWHTPGHIQDIVNKLQFPPDFILLNDMKKTHCPEITGLSSLKIPFGIIIHDLHYKNNQRKKFIDENNVRHIFSIYRDSFISNYPAYVDRMHWLPHFAETSVFKDYAMPKEINCLIMGRISKHYPLRKRMLNVMKSIPGFVYHSHPGYRDVKEDEPGIYVGEKYAREINRAKIFLTCDLTFHYPIRKYYEVLASKTLLLAPNSLELNDLGFIPGKHFVPINENNFLEMADYYLNHPKERDEIAEQGYIYVHQQHSTEKRAGQLLKFIEDIIQEKN
jgi:hypothetical protein